MRSTTWVAGTFMGAVAVAAFLGCENGDGGGGGGGFSVMDPYVMVDLGVSSVTGHLYVPDILTNETYKTTKLVLKRVDAGGFQMGDKVGGHAADELPVHTVNITEPFFMGIFEVTQRQWYEVMGDWPSHFTTNPDKRPVECVSWNDFQTFLAQLCSETGHTFSLPTEAQWEYACKAGTSTNYSYGDTEDGAYMWYQVNSDTGSGRETHEVGTRLPNPWGLYDMHGNVWEYCADLYDSGYYSVSPADDPEGPASGTWRVHRGGGWDNAAVGLRSSCRNSGDPSNGNSTGIGFRVVLVP